MIGFCPECATPLNNEGNCPAGHSEGLPLGIGFAPTPGGGGEPIRGTGTYTASTFESQGIGPLPKASTGRRLIGSGIEFLGYVTVLVLLNFVSPWTFGTFGAVVGTPLFVVVLIRDINAGAFSMGKRVGRLRVVDRKTAQAASNNQAIIRNSYYLILLLVAIVPFFKTPPTVLFLLLILIDTLMIMASPEGRRLGDLLAGTQVIQEKRR